MRVMVLGVGAFAHSMMQILKEAGAEVSAYLTRDYGHYGPMVTGTHWLAANHPSPLPLIAQWQPHLIIPMSIDWHTAPWASELLAQKAPLLSPAGEAIKIESERRFAMELAHRFGVAIPIVHTVKNRLEALQLMEKDPRPYVLKNPLCSPYSPIHTIVCESIADTFGWLERVDYAEGVFLQEYLGKAEAGHFVFISGGEAYSLVTNQEYKRAFTGNMGPVAGAPLGGLVEQDPQDRYGLARALIHPLLPWLREVGFHGPLQVTAMQREGVWYPVEYNVRLGVTSGAMILRMLENPLEALQDVVQNRPLHLRWRTERRFGCSLTLAGYGYPYVIPSVPRLPVTLESQPTCDLWWNEVESHAGTLCMNSHKVPIMGHRIADVNAYGQQLSEAIALAYENIRKIHCLASYYRLDVGQSLWPPGTGY